MSRARRRPCPARQLRLERARLNVRAQHAQAGAIERLVPLRRRRFEPTCRRLCGISTCSGVPRIPDQRDVAKHDRLPSGSYGQYGRVSTDLFGIAVEHEAAELQPAVRRPRRGPHRDDPRRMDVVVREELQQRESMKQALILRRERVRPQAPERRRLARSCVRRSIVVRCACALLAATSQAIEYSSRESTARFAQMQARRNATM